MRRRVARAAHRPHQRHLGGPLLGEEVEELGLGGVRREPRRHHPVREGVAVHGEVGALPVAREADAEEAQHRRGGAAGALQAHQLGAHRLPVAEPRDAEGHLVALLQAQVPHCLRAHRCGLPAQRLRHLPAPQHSRERGASLASRARGVDHGAPELLKPPRLGGLRVALGAAANSELQHVVLGHLLRHRARRRGQRRLRLRQVHVAPVLPDHLRARHEAEAAAVVVGLHHAQESPLGELGRLLARSRCTRLPRRRRLHRPRQLGHRRRVVGRAQSRGGGHFGHRGGGHDSRRARVWSGGRRTAISK
mmetsp:Transcript_86921/g.242457  ORF Transcript_86921/g.242457 Transcript_86921/m.242457 type:complete len:306 (-) Transcript_86921:29-946(-)